MKIRLCLPLLLVFLLAACQPAPANMDAAATQIVATAAVSIQQTVIAGLPTPAPAPSASAAPAQPAAQSAPFTGIWIAENGDVLVLTDALLYYRFTKGDTVYEHLGEVQGYDVDKGEMDFFLQGIRLNGRGVGYDYPQNKARFAIDQDTLTFKVLVDPENPAAGVRLSGTFRRAFTDRFPPQ